MNTPATRMMVKHGVPYTVHEYEYVEHGGTAVSSESLGVPEHEVVKTLVMEDEEKKPLIVLMHGDRTVSTQDLARQTGRKRSSRAGRRWRSATPATRSAARPPSACESRCRSSSSAPSSSCRRSTSTAAAAAFSYASRPPTWCGCSPLRRSTSLDRDADEFGVRNFGRSEDGAVDRGAGEERSNGEHNQSDGRGATQSELWELLHTGPY